MTQMMRTNADALRVLTASHVDLAKSIAVAKGLPRNAAMSILPTVVSENDEDDEEDGENEIERPKTLYDVVHPIAQQLAPVLGGLLVGKIGGASPQPEPRALVAGEPPEGMTDEEVELARKPSWEIRDVVDLGYAQRKGAAKRKLKCVSTDALSRASGAPRPSIPPALLARVMADPALQQKLFAIKNQLQRHDIDALMSVLAQASEGEIQMFVDQLKDAPEALCLHWVREIVAMKRPAANEANG